MAAESDAEKPSGSQDAQNHKGIFVGDGTLSQSDDLLHLLHPRIRPSRYMLDPPFFTLATLRNLRRPGAEDALHSFLTAATDSDLSTDPVSGSYDNDNLVAMSTEESEDDRAMAVALECLATACERMPMKAASDLFRVRSWSRDLVRLRQATAGSTNQHLAEACPQDVFSLVKIVESGGERGILKIQLGSGGSVDVQWPATEKRSQVGSDSENDSPLSSDDMLNTGGKGAQSASETAQSRPTTPRKASPFKSSRTLTTPTELSVAASSKCNGTPSLGIPTPDSTPETKASAYELPGSIEPLTPSLWRHHEALSTYNTSPPTSTPSISVEEQNPVPGPTTFTRHDVRNAAASFGNDLTDRSKGRCVSSLRALQLPEAEAVAGPPAYEPPAARRLLTALSARVALPRLAEVERRRSSPISLRDNAAAGKKRKASGEPEGDIGRPGFKVTRTGPSIQDMMLQCEALAQSVADEKDIIPETLRLLDAQFAYMMEIINFEGSRPDGTNEKKQELAATLQYCEMIMGQILRASNAEHRKTLPNLPTPLRVKVTMVAMPLALATVAAIAFSPPLLPYTMQLAVLGCALQACANAAVKEVRSTSQSVGFARQSYRDLPRTVNLMKAKYIELAIHVSGVSRHDDPSNSDLSKKRG